MSPTTTMLRIVSTSVVTATWNSRFGERRTRFRMARTAATSTTVVTSAMADGPSEVQSIASSGAPCASMAGANSTTGSVATKLTAGL